MVSLRLLTFDFCLSTSIPVLTTSTYVVAWPQGFEGRTSRGGLLVGDGIDGQEGAEGGADQVVEALHLRPTRSPWASWQWT